MANIEAIRTEVEKFRPNGYHTVEEVFKRLSDVVEFFKWLDEQPGAAEPEIEVRQGALKTDGGVNVKMVDLDLWNKEIKRRFYGAMDKGDVCEFYSVKAGEIMIDITFNGLFAVDDGFIDEEFVIEKMKLGKTIRKILEQDTEE